MPAPRRRRALLAVAKAAALAVALGLAGAGFAWALLPDPTPLALRNPPTTALIEQRRAEATRAKRRFHPQQVWVPWERISPRLVQAVVASEDAKFFGHAGFDWDALREAARHDVSKGRFARGASTITQQLAKNLWLGTDKSLLRKAREALLAAKLERTLDKRRILTLYLNVAEWGDGTFGVEAGARRHLGVSAATVDTAQAVLLASMLPAPRRVDLAHPSPWLRARATHLLDRLHAEHAIDDAEHRSASTALARLLGEAAPADEKAAPPEDEEAPATEDSTSNPIATPTETSTPNATPTERPLPLSPTGGEGQGAGAPHDGPSPSPAQGEGTARQEAGSPPAQAPPPQE